MAISNSRLSLPTLIRNNYVEFVQKMQVDEDLCSHMVQGRIFSEGNVDDIMSNRSARGRSAEFLRIVQTRGERAKVVWINALVATSQLDLADLLDPQTTAQQEVEHYGTSTQTERITLGSDHRFSQPTIPGKKTPLNIRSASTFGARKMDTSSDRLTMLNRTGSLDSPRTPPGEYGTPSLPRPETSDIIQVEDYTSSNIELQVKKLSRGNGLIKKMDTGADGCYKIRSSHPRGSCLIICNTEFRNEPRRPGGSTDCENLTPLLDQLGIVYTIHENLTAKDMISTIRDYREFDFGDDDMFLICIMSHGHTGQVLGIDDQAVNIQRDIIRPFQPDQCPGLSQKPKIVLVQACQGDKFTRGVTLPEGSYQTESDGPPSPEQSPVQQPVQQPVQNASGVRGNQADIHNIHPDQDFLVAYSTSPGYVSYREEQGTWFIRAFVIEMYNHCHREHLADIMTKVTNAVSRFRTQSQHIEFDQCIQLPFYQSQLKKKLYLCVSEDA